MWAQELIRRKRDGGGLRPTEIERLMRGYVEDAVSDAQMAAFCMAVFFRGMSEEETSSLVQAMLGSGEVVDLSDIDGIKVDKHSTGGVGDKISICLAPLVAACGVPVPMMSGRGLGHTGGTLDKLSAIPGFRTNVDIACYRDWVRRHQLAFIGQTSEVAPADRRLYALRDVTGTVESIPLIAASIMSKKLAEGIDALVLDVKVGSGAFMKTLTSARQLAEALRDIGSRAGKSTHVLMTRMDQVLGSAVGNANETWEAVQVLQGEGPDDVRELTLELAAEMLLLGKQAIDRDDARRQAQAAIASGRGFQKLQEVVEAQGGDPRALEHRSGLPMAPHRHEISVDRSGWVETIDVEKVGRAAMWLGAGRTLVSDPVDPSVGLEMMVGVGDRLSPGDLLAVLEHRDGRGVEESQALLRNAVTLTDAGPSAESPLVIDRLET